MASPKARDLTVSWLRWGYFGRILTGNSVGAILKEAAESDYEYCLLQSCGHMIAERGGAFGSSSSSFFEALELWISQHDFFVAGKGVRREGETRLNCRCLLFNLRHYERLGRPRFEPCSSEPSLMELSDRIEAPIIEFGDEIGAYLYDLGANLERDPEAVRSLADASANAQRGIFVLNFESYLDVEAPPPYFEAPLTALYSVAAGLKPNRILETHGFDLRTEVIFFDYSAAGLEFRRHLVREWDGRDYPAFLRGLLRRIPASAAHYYLWHGGSPEAMDGQEMEKLWNLETERWGGADRFADHWARYRELRHEFILANILASPEELLRQIQSRGEAAIWWSNAFSTVYSAWRFSLEEKRRLYESWISELASRAPRILFYGSDHSNSSVNSMRARDYWAAYQAVGGDPLAERRLCRHRIRF